MNTQHPPIHILGICGSLRRKSNNRALLVAAQEMLPNGVTMGIADLTSLPLYNKDVEDAGTPESVLAFRSQIRQADALYIASPEYNYSITGALKNAIDWASRNIPDKNPLDGKTAAFMGVGGRLGTARSQDHLRDILAHNDIAVLPKPNILLHNNGTLFDENGRLIDPDARHRIQNQLNALIAWTQKLQQPLQESASFTINQSQFTFLNS